MSAKEEFDELLEIAKEFLQVVTGELDNVTSIKGEVSLEEGQRRVVLLTPSHIQFARYGRGPGKKPPFESILEWIKRENIKFENSSQEGTAWAIQNSIGLHGTKNWVTNAPSFLEETLSTHMKEYQEKLGKKLIVIINDEVNKIYKEISFKEIL